MPVTRRQSLGLIGSALALPYVLRTDEAFAAPPRLIRVGPPVRVGASQPGGQAFINLAPFENSQGGFIATWINYIDATFNARDYCQYFTNDRRARTGPIEIGGGTGSARLRVSQQPRPVTFPDGTALVFFAATRVGAPGSEGAQLYVQRMSAARAKVGAPIRVNTITTGGNAIILATRLTNGNVLVVWQNAAGTIDSIDTHCRVVNKQGVGLFPERIATKERVGQQIPKSICSLAGGNSVLSYVSVNLVAKTWRVLLQRLSPSGLRLGEPILVKATSSDRPFGAAAVASPIRSGVSGSPEAAFAPAFAAVFAREETIGITIKFRYYKGDATLLRERGFVVEDDGIDDPAYQGASPTLLAPLVADEIDQIAVTPFGDKVSGLVIYGSPGNLQVAGPFLLFDPLGAFSVDSFIQPISNPLQFNIGLTTFGNPQPANIDALVVGVEVA